MLEAVRILVAELYTPLAVNFVAGVGVAKVLSNCETNSSKLLKLKTGLVTTPLRAPGPTLKRGLNSGRPLDAGAGAAGTIVSGGSALKVVMSILCAPMRISPAPKAGLVRSMLKPLSVSVANGAAVPRSVQLTTLVAETVCLALIDSAMKSGGAVPKGLVNPSIHNRSPGATVAPSGPAGNARVPLLTR